MKKTKEYHEAMRMARQRKKEIARKVEAQRLQASGYVPSQLGKVTSDDRLIACDHFHLKGKAAELYHKREAIKGLEAKIREEKRKAEGFSHKYVKRDANGKTVGVDKVYVK